MPSKRLTVASSDDGLHVRAYLPGDETALIELFKAVFGRARTLEQWRWLYERAPEGHAHIWVLVDGDHLVGSVAHIPLSAFVEDHRRRLALGADMMVADEQRGNGATRRLMEAFLACDHGFELNFGCINEASALVLRRSNGTVPLGKIPVWVRFRTRGRRLPALARHGLSFAERAYGRAATLRRPGLEVIDLSTLGPDVDAFARDSAAFAPCIRVRDSAYLHWHWFEQPGGDWQARAVREADGSLRGLAILGTREEGREGRVVELLARDYDCTCALLCDAFEVLCRAGCTRVSCAYLDPRAWSRRAFLRSGFRRISEDSFVACGALSPSAGHAAERLENWLLTHGDADI